MTRILVAAVCLCAATPVVRALDGVLSVGGTYRYGHVHWTSTGSTVEFTVEAAFKRAMTDLSTWTGTAPDGLAKVGDEVVFPGRIPPQFYFGDGMVEETLKMTVNSFSESEDWVMGSLKIVHVYATPNNKGAPWEAQFTGCCRHSYLVNNKDAEWVIAAPVDLNSANKSPRANVLPMVSVPFKPLTGSPFVYVSAEDNADDTIEYRVGKPWDVGNAAVFKSADKSFVAVPLSTLAPFPCTTATAGAGNNFAGPGCLFRALRTDSGQKASTVEGWVLSSKDEGGYVMTVGANDGHGVDGYAGPAPDARCDAADENHPICRVASLMIKVDQTHVFAGHEVLKDDNTVMLQQESFEICSNSYLASDYLCTPTKTTTNKWFHLAVVRFQHTVSGGSSTGASRSWVSYKVLVNGRPLKVASYPGGPSRQRKGETPCGDLHDVKCSNCPVGCPMGSYCSSGTCTICAACESSDQFRYNCRGTSAGQCKLEPERSCASSGSKCFENGESNLVQGPVPPSTNTTSSSFRDFAKGASLIFGAYKGAKNFDAPQYFDGSLDEWRFWNGARSDSALLNDYKRPMTVSREKFYGDPSDPTRRITMDNYLVSSVLMASWSFDQLCPLSGSTGCALQTLQSVYPKDQDARVPYPPGKSIYKAYPYKTKTGETDYQGRMFYSLSDGMEIDSKGKLTVHTQLVGDHQVVVIMSYPGNVAPVPVDFIIKVVPAGCFEDTDDSTKNDCAICDAQTMLDLPQYTCGYDKAPGVVNEYMPMLSIKASVLPSYGADLLAGNAYNVGEEAVEDIENNLYPYYIRMYAGFELKLQLHAQDKQEKKVTVDNFEGVYYDHIFTKVGFTIGRMPAAVKFTTVYNTNPAQMDLAWTPCSSDVGRHTLCFEATDSHQAQGDMPNRPFAPSSSSEQKCVQVLVEQEEAPHFIVGADATPVSPQMCTMGKPTQLKVHVGSANCQATMLVSAQAGTQLPEGASLERISSDRKQQSDISPELCVTAEFHLIWTPLLTQGGFNKTVCLEANSVHTGGCTGTTPKPDVHCMQLYVQRCRYSMQLDQQLQEIASLFNIDWMRLWSLNPTLLHPDYVIYGGQNIMIGHLYSALSNELPLEIAKRMGMPDVQMKALNYGLDLAARLEAGDEVCVVPNSCSGAVNSKYSGLDSSSLSSYLGRTAADVHPIQASQHAPPSNMRH